jgi:uncharacterized protein YegP (UPF0339 family)
MGGQAHFEVYPLIHGASGGPEVEFTLTGEFGWRFQSANGQITATSGEGYTRREDASRAIHDLLDEVDPEGAGTDRTHAPIIDIELDGTPAELEEFNDTEGVEPDDE